MTMKHEAIPEEVTAISDQEQVARLLREVGEGVDGAWDRVYALLYRDLRQVALSLLRQRYWGHHSSPTSLVSEAWLRLAGADLHAKDRAHLMTLIARAMRFALIDQVRRFYAEKRGDGMALLDLDNALEPGYDLKIEQLLDLDRALSELARIDPRLSSVVELRCFGGMGLEEIAGILDVNERTVRRDWTRARAFLHGLLIEEGSLGPA